MEKIIPNNTEVLIFNNKKNHNKNLNEINYIKGKIISSKLSHDLSHHGSPWQVQIYTILGEDGKEYKGTYGSAIIGDNFIRTIEDHIKHIKSTINDNKKQINDLQNEINLLWVKMIDLQNINQNNKEEKAKEFETNNLTNTGPVLKKTKNNDKQ